MYGQSPCEPSGGLFDATCVRPQFPSRQSVEEKSKIGRIERENVINKRCFYENILLEIKFRMKIHWKKMWTKNLHFSINHYLDDNYRIGCLCLDSCEYLKKSRYFSMKFSNVDCFWCETLKRSQKRVQTLNILCSVPMIGLSGSMIEARPGHVTC